MGKLKGSENFPSKEFEMADKNQWIIIPIAVYLAGHVVFVKLLTF